MLLRNLPLIVLSVAYWDIRFLRRGGPLFFLRAVVAQVRYVARGLSERRQVTDVKPGRWLPWLTHQRLRDIRALRVARGEA